MSDLLCPKCGKRERELVKVNIDPWTTTDGRIVAEGQTVMELFACRDCHPQHFEASK